MYVHAWERGGWTGRYTSPCSTRVGNEAATEAVMLRPERCLGDLAGARAAGNGNGNGRAGTYMESTLVMEWSTVREM